VPERAKTTSSCGYPPPGNQRIGASRMPSGMVYITTFRL